MEKPIYHNLMEDIVLAKLDKAIESTGGCGCNICRADIMAYTLNHLPPCYATTSHGKLMVRMNSYETQFQADITAALMEASVLIAKNPRH